MSRSALILAGGPSERFGSPKALVEISGRPIVSHVAEAFAPLADETIVSVGDTDMARRIALVLPKATFAMDGRRDAGPIEGFRQGFRAAHGEIVLVAPCDAPLLRTPLYRLLLHRLGNSDAAVPRPADTFDPVRAVYRRSAVVQVLESSRVVPSPSALVDILRPVFLDADELRTVDPELASFFDLNTPEDLETVRERWRSTRKARHRA